MSDIFGKVISFIMVAVLLFIVPVTIASEEHKISEKMYLYTESVALCEQVKNTGVLKTETYEALSRVTAGILEVYDIEIWSVNSENVMTADDEIKARLETDGRYDFEQGDYIRIKIKDNKGIQVYCGGMIKYNETD